MFRSVVFRTLIISVLLHAGLVLFLWNDKVSGDSAVTINVQYQGSDGGTSEAVKRPNKTEVPLEATKTISSAAAGSNGVDGPRADAEVSGESLGLHAVYPKLSRVLGESGQVQIAVKNNQAFIAISSGFKRLDESALASTNSALKSGVLGSAYAGPDSLLINFIFRLK